MNPPRLKLAHIRPSPATAEIGEADFMAVLPLIDRIATRVCRLRRLNRADTEDFRSDVHLHFIENNYEVLRRYEGRASHATFFTVVIVNRFLDRRTDAGGRWRPSREARERGLPGKLLERLIVCDGWTTEQALDTLRLNHGVPIDDGLRALGDKAARHKPSRTFVSEEAAGELASDGLSPEAGVVGAEQDCLAQRVLDALERARQQLSPTDQLILKMKFDGVSVADIARRLHLEQRPLYRRIDGVLHRLRDSMKAEGISRRDVETLLADDTLIGEMEDGARNVNAGTGRHPAQPTRGPWPQDR